MHKLRTILIIALVAGFPVTSFAALRVPKSAPLQPMPAGQAPNVSHNIQSIHEQTDTTSTSANAAQTEGSPSSSPVSNASANQVPSSQNSQESLISQIWIWLISLIGAGLIAAIYWRWRHKHYLANKTLPADKAKSN